MKRGLAALALLGSWVAACDRQPATANDPAPASQESPASSTARRDVYDEFKRGIASRKDPSDGGGRAWLELPDNDNGSVVAGTRGHWTIEYEAGPLGVAAGGAVYLQVSPFWEWSTPQVTDEGAPGFTRVSSQAAGVTLVPRTLAQQLLGIEIGGRALAQGERIRIEYGAGPELAHSDAYAEKNSRFWIAVDGDGDGVRKVLADSPGVDVLAGPPARLVATLPSTAKPGESVRLCLALLDQRANAGIRLAARVDFPERPDGLELPASVELAPDDLGRKTISFAATKPDVYRLKVHARVGDVEFETVSNPLVVAATGPRILWADLHGHSAVSDGTGTPEDYFTYARDVAALDVAALTDHDHWGLLFLDENPQLWKHNVDVAQAFQAPGRFVTLPGYEWTNWISGHRHVLYFGDETPLFSSMDPKFETPQELWSALRGKQALTIPHHPAGGPVAIDWTDAPDGELEPVAELCSAHGSSEVSDCPRMIYSPQPGHFVRDALERGYAYGLVASGDGHDGHPGLTALGPHYPTGGLAAILSEDLTRPALYSALRARRVYATSGPRIVLRFALANARMGESVAADLANRANNLFVQVIAAAPLEAIDIVQRRAAVVRIPGESRLELTQTATLSDLRSGDWVYVRVVQRDGGMAWSSPVFVR
jgi:hypothetical protein